MPAIARLRRLIFELRPPALDNEGLAAALPPILDEADETTTTTYRLKDHLTTEPPEAIRVILYRIAQEVLTNIRKHADAGTATVTLDARDAGYYVHVHDDGVGFTPEDRCHAARTPRACGHPRTRRTRRRLAPHPEHTKPG